MLFNVVLSSFAATLALRASAVRTSTIISETLCSAHIVPMSFGRESYLGPLLKTQSHRSAQN